MPFDELFAKARADLEVLQEIARPLGAQVVIQIHHGNIVSTSSSARRLVDGLDPVAVMHHLGTALSTAALNYATRKTIKPNNTG